MAGPKKAASKKAPAKRSAAPTQAVKQETLLKRAARDPYRGPSSKQIEKSFDKGTTVTLDSFRNIIDWS
jgi:hypothetical protein